MTTSDYFQLLAPRTVNLFTLNLTFHAAYCQSLHAHFQIVSPLLHTASCCVYCFKSQKQKTWRKMAADAFYLLNYIDCIDEQALPGTVSTPDTLPPGVWKSIFLHRRSCVPGLSNQHSRLCSGCFPVCSADTWPRNFLLLVLLCALSSAGQTFTN